MKRLLSSLSLCMALIMQPAQADLTQECNDILNRAQLAFPDLFPTKPDTQFLGPWCFRAYPLGLLAGVNRIKSKAFPIGVYVLGPPFGDEPTFIGTTSQVTTLLDDLLGPAGGGGGGNNQEAICDSGDSELTGLFHTVEDNNTIKITTKGECIMPPENTSFCEVRAETDNSGELVATDIHALTNTEIASVKFTGYTSFAIPGVPNLQDTIEQNLSNTTCIIHAPTHFDEVTVETDICMDMTEQFAGIPGTADKVTMEFRGKSTSMIVDDCFDTNANSITDLVLKKTYIKQFGSFIPLN